MKASITVRWLKNHGVRVSRTTKRGIVQRFEAHAGSVDVSEAAAAVGSYTTKLYRMIEAGALKCRMRSGAVRIPVAELWRLKRDPALLEDGRRKRNKTA